MFSEASSSSSSSSSSKSAQDTTRDNNNQFVKIWFAKPGSPPLGALNEYRLFCHKSRFPGDTISLLSNYEDFTVENQNHMIEFCRKNNITLIGLNEIEKQITDSSLGDKKIQLELLKIARQEIEASTCFGSVAAASDIVRTLSPAQVGCYMDLDVNKLKPFAIEQKIWGNVFGLALATKVEYDAKRGSFQSLGINNNVLFCNESKNNFLTIYRAWIHDNYHNANNKFFNIVQELNEEKIFDLSSYKATSQYMKDHKTDLKGLPYALKFKCAYKACASAENHNKFLKAFVIHVSGPKCMQCAFDAFIGSRVIPTCDALKKLKDGDHLIKGALQSLAISLLEGEVEDNQDQSWLPSYDQSGSRLKKMEDSAIKIQSVVRMHQIQKSIR